VYECLTSFLRGFGQILVNLIICFFVYSGLLIQKPKLFSQITIVVNSFLIAWGIVTAIAVLNQDMWNFCSDSSTGKYQQVLAPVAPTTVLFGTVLCCYRWRVTWVGRLPSFFCSLASSRKRFPSAPR
jgi:hypothetical protein